MSGKVLTQNPDPNKKGVRIDKDKYNIIRDAIIEAVRDKGPLGAMQLVQELDERIGDEKFGASVGWHTTAIRLDMEAKGEILYNRHDKKPAITLSK